MCTFYAKLFLLLFAFAYCITELTTIKTTTLDVRKRVAILKKQIKNEIKAKIGKNPLPIEENSSFEFNEFENDSGFLMPVMTAEKKIKTKTKKVTATSVKTPAKSTTIKQANVTTPISQKHKQIGKEREKKKLRISNVSSEMKSEEKDIFYRRMLNEYEMNKEVQWAHCQDMITPYLTGVKTDLTHPKHYSTKHPIVIRFIQLLNENTTLYTKEDIYSILYQISNLHLRLFQWDVPALNLLFNVLIKEGRHTFLNLKRGIREHFDEWRLDISNVTNLLRQTRIFRPPCVRISDSTGSTKSKQASKYPKKTSPTTTCESEDDFDCKHRH